MTRIAVKTETASSGSQRLDKWLWYARVAKTRTLASSLVTSGKIRVNRTKTDKPSHAVRAGDVITSSASRTVRILEVTSLGTRRGPPAEAQVLYRELTVRSDRTKSGSRESLQEGEASGWARSAGERLAGSGRPTKRDRRLIIRFKDNPGEG